MHNNLKAKFTYLRISDKIEELFDQLKSVVKLEAKSSKKITHKIE